MRFEDLFFLGMKRPLPQLFEPRSGFSVGLGESGKENSAEPGMNHTSLGLPNWEWPRDKIPFADEHVNIVHAYHFLEHLSGEDAISMLIEVERVLAPGGIFQFCIPYAGTELAMHDLTHKSNWTESTFRTLFGNDYYDVTDHKWQLKIHYLVIAGIVERNLALLGQLVKE